jgi:hypothetical protein
MSSDLRRLGCENSRLEVSPVRHHNDAPAVAGLSSPGSRSLRWLRSSRTTPRSATCSSESSESSIRMRLVLWPSLDNSSTQKSLRRRGPPGRRSLAAPKRLSRWMRTFPASSVAAVAHCPLDQYGRVPMFASSTDTLLRGVLSAASTTCPCAVKSKWPSTRQQPPDAAITRAIVVRARIIPPFARWPALTPLRTQQHPSCVAPLSSLTGTLGRISIAKPMEYYVRTRGSVPTMTGREPYSFGLDCASTRGSLK